MMGMEDLIDELSGEADRGLRVLKLVRECRFLGH
jgi:hypothetical protein